MEKNRLATVVILRIFIGLYEARNFWNNPRNSTTDPWNKGLLWKIQEGL